MLWNQKSGPTFQKTERSKLLVAMRFNVDKAIDFAKRYPADEAPAMIKSPPIES